MSQETYGARSVYIRTICHNTGTALLQGRVHCPVSLSSGIDGRVEILAYDFEANDIIRMATPLEYCHALRVADGYLCALDEWAVWVMKEFGDEESWTISMLMVLMVATFSATHKKHSTLPKNHGRLLMESYMKVLCMKKNQQHSYAFNIF